MLQPTLNVARMSADLTEVARNVSSRFQLHDTWLDLLTPFGFDRALVFDDTLVPGPLSNFASRNQRHVEFEDARRDAVRYLADYPVLRQRAAISGDVIQLTPKDTWLRVYQEHGVPYGQRQVLMIALHGRGRPLCVITLSRDTPTSQPFSQRVLDCAVELAPLLSLSDLAWSAEVIQEPPSYALLTYREREVARLVCRGLTNAEISRVLGSSINTVRNQVASIFRKLAVSTRAELAGLR